MTAPEVISNRTELESEPISGLGAALEAMKSVPWTTLEELKGDEAVLKKLDEAEGLLRSLRGALTPDRA